MKSVPEFDGVNDAPSDDGLVGKYALPVTIVAFLLLGIILFHETIPFEYTPPPGWTSLSSPSNAGRNTWCYVPEGRDDFEKGLISVQFLDAAVPLSAEQLVERFIKKFSIPTHYAGEKYERRKIDPYIEFDDMEGAAGEIKYYAPKNKQFPDFIIVAHVFKNKASGRWMLIHYIGPLKDYPQFEDDFVNSLGTISF